MENKTIIQAFSKGNIRIYTFPIMQMPLGSMTLEVQLHYDQGLKCDVTWKRLINVTTESNKNC